MTGSAIFPTRSILVITGSEADLYSPLRGSVLGYLVFQKVLTLIFDALE
jgi:hypothetical protein